jgi:hypothetical protein
MRTHRTPVSRRQHKMRHPRAPSASRHQRVRAQPLHPKAVVSRAEVVVMIQTEVTDTGYEKSESLYE